MIYESTHIAIWAVLNDPKLPKQAKDIILDKENDMDVNAIF